MAWTQLKLGSWTKKENMIWPIQFVLILWDKPAVIVITNTQKLRYEKTNV